MKKSQFFLVLILPFVICNSRNRVTVSTSETSRSCGPGDLSCESNVRTYINGVNGVEVNFISYIQNKDGSPSGKFRVGFLKQDERGMNQYSATISTDFNCKVIDAGGISSY